MIEMAKLDLEYVQRFNDRHGRLRHYFRRPGFKRQALPGLVGSAEFMAAYDTCLRGEKVTAGAARTIPGSVSALLALYYGTAEFKRLADSTKATYRNMLDRFRDKYGHLSAIGLQTRHLDAIFDEMADRPGAVRNLRKRLRRVFRMAVKKAWRPDNPVTETDAPESGGEGFTPWSEADIAAYEKRWPSGTRERLALAILLCTSVRRSDAVALGRQHLEGEKIRIIVYKGRKRTPTELVIPVLPDLRREIDQAPLGMTFLLTQYGAPFSPAGFTAWFVERAEMAGLKNRTPHGLRKASSRRMAESGSTEKQIASVTGHRTLSEVARYTRSADQAKLADQAMTKLQAGS